MNDKTNCKNILVRHRKNTFMLLSHAKNRLKNTAKNNNKKKIYCNMCKKKK